MKEELRLTKNVDGSIEEPRGDVKSISEAKHTPGPWEPCDVNLPMGPFNGVRAGESGMICDLRWQGDATQANACLIAAAPDMLQALEEFVAFSEIPAVVEAWGLSNRPSSALVRARAALAKARGESDA